MKGGAEPKAPAWKRNLLVLSGTQLLTISAMSCVLPFIPFFVRELGVTDRAAVERWSGLIFSGPFLAAALMSPVWGHLGDRYGHKMMVVRAIVGLAIGNLVVVFVQTPLQFYLVRLFQGMVSGFVPASLAITSSTTPREQVPAAIGRLQASASAGRLIGPAVGGALAGLLAFRSIFLAVGLAIAFAAVAIILFLENPERPAVDRETSMTDVLKYLRGDGRLRIALPGLLLTMSAVSMVMPVFPLFVEDLLPFGANAPFVTGIGFATVAGFTMLTASVLGRITERFGLKPTLLVGLLLTAVALGAHPLAKGVVGLLAVRALLGVGIAGVQPTLFATISRIAPEGMRGGIAGMASSATILGFFVGPLLGGWLANHVGVGGVFEIAAALTLLCAVGAAIVAKRHRRGRELRPVPVLTPR